MSVTITSMLSMTAFAGPRLPPSYSDAIGIPVTGSTDDLTCSPASAVPRKPCSGEKMVVTLTPPSSITSRVWRSPTIPVWLLNRATRSPSSRGKYSSVRSAPVFRAKPASAAAHMAAAYSNMAVNTIKALPFTGILVLSLHQRYQLKLIPSNGYRLNMAANIQ